MSCRRAVVVAALVVSPLAHAQTPAPAQQLPAVTVTAGRGSAIEKLDVSTTVITRDAIQAMPETGVDQIVGRIPGVWVPTIPTGQLHPTGQPFNIRGFGTSTTINTLVLLDGVPMNDPFFRTVDWSLIPKASIERIEVIRGGGATSLWGNMAMGGIVNIVTREPSHTGGALDINYGSYNTTNSEADASWVPNDRLRAGLSYGHAQSNGYNLTPSQFQNSNLVPTASKADNVNFSAYLAPDAANKLFAKAYFHQAYEDGLVWNIAHNQWSTWRLLLGATHQFDDKSSSLNFSAWAGGGTFGTINASNGSYSLVNTSATNQFVSQIEQAPNNNQGGSLFWQFDAGEVKDVKIGIDARRTEIADYNSLFASATAAPTMFVAHGEHRLEGLFAQGTWRPSAVPVDVTLGVRGDFFQAVNASVLNVNSATNTFIPDAQYASFDPRLGVKYYATDQLVLRAAAYRNFSAPGMNQMYRSFASGASFTTTNPNLQPMTNIGEEVGADFTWREFTLSATWFNNNLDNFIDFVAVCSSNAACAAPFATAAGLSGITSVNQYINVGSAVFQGFEVLGGWQPLKQLRFTGSFTSTTAYLTSSTVPNLERTGVQLGQVPIWTINAGAEWRPIAELALNVNLKSFPAYWANTAHTQLNEAATLIDLGATYSFNKSVDLYGTIQNLTNVQYLASGYTLTSFEGPTVSNTSIPALGMPFTALVGLRARF
ncbi:MAG TPA: TonB-dependent receptor [Reyranella sp.]|nr:TonB-dependent receptor [Reyranella sp.]